MPESSIRTILAVFAWIVACVIAAWLGAVMAMTQLPQPMLTDEKEPPMECPGINQHVCYSMPQIGEVQKKQLII